MIDFSRPAWLSGEVCFFFGLFMRLLAALLVLTLCSAPAFAARMALVLGNGAYTYDKPLPNATNDAQDMAARLRQIGFTVFEGINLNRRDTLKLVQTFSQTLQSDDTALLYYAGHGIQMGGEQLLDAGGCPAGGRGHADRQFHQAAKHPLVARK